MEKKQLLVISTNSQFISGLEATNLSGFQITSVQNLHAGYSLALSYLPDAILIDYTSLDTENPENLQTFKSTHFLNKSFLFLYAHSEKRAEVETYFRDHVDEIVYDSVSTAFLLKKINEFVSVKQCLTNYWRDSFLGLFNLLSHPVILLQNDEIVAMNDSFKKFFFVTSSSHSRITDIVDEENKNTLLMAIRNFTRGKHMRTTFQINLVLKDSKMRRAKISFSKLDKDLNDQLVMMINFSETEALFSEQQLSQREKQGSIGKQNDLREFSFTKREKEIISLLCKGYKTREISEALCISSKTIEKHRSNIIRRTNSDTMLESVVYALNNKMIEI